MGRGGLGGSGLLIGFLLYFAGDFIGDEGEAFGGEVGDAVADMLRAEDVLDHLLHRLVALGRVFGQCLADDAGERLFDAFEVRFGGHMFHEDFGGGGAEEGDLAGEHFVEQDAQGVDVDAFVIAAGADFRGHVVDGADGDGLAAVAAGGHHLGQAVVADFDVAVFVKDIAGFKVAVDDAAIMEVGEALGDFAEEIGGFLRAQAGGGFGQQVMQGRPGDIFHDYKGAAFVIVFDVEDGDQVGVFQVHALADAAQLDVLVVLDGLEGHLAAAVAEGVIDLAEAAASGGPLDRITFQRLVTILILKWLRHGFHYTIFSLSMKFRYYQRERSGFEGSTQG
ncbi:MAG: hypothetical protein BWY71_00473 [Planctomycetes bacterium ADurb.Bin412]|nr:MAG: hypothetical protein BWY71_00473 [Planctomycetes bacterium ADurb.Bin412]